MLQPEAWRAVSARRACGLRLIFGGQAGSVTGSDLREGSGGAYGEQAGEGKPAGPRGWAWSAEGELTLGPMRSDGEGGVKPPG